MSRPSSAMAHGNRSVRADDADLTKYTWPSTRDELAQVCLRAGQLRDDGPVQEEGT